MVGSGGEELSIVWVSACPVLQAFRFSVLWLIYLVKWSLICRTAAVCYGLSLTLVRLCFLSVSSRVCFRDGALGETYFAVVEALQVCTTYCVVTLHMVFVFAFDLAGVLRERRRFRELTAAMHSRRPHGMLEVSVYLSIADRARIKRFTCILGNSKEDPYGACSTNEAAFILVAFLLLELKNSLQKRWDHVVATDRCPAVDMRLVFVTWRRTRYLAGSWSLQPTRNTGVRRCNGAYRGP